MNVYHKNGLSITYEIIRKSNKNAYFRIKEGILKVTAHPKTTRYTIESFIDLKFDTFYQKINESKMKEPDYQIKLWNQNYEIIQTYGRFHYQLSDQLVYLKSQSNHIENDKKRIYAHELKKMIEKITPEINEVISYVGLVPLPIKIKYLRSKFGSYHRKNNEITLNSYLARLDVIYLKYVIYHEYAHALVFNHSKDFYTLLDKLMPNHQVYQKDLKKIAIT